MIEEARDRVPVDAELPSRCGGDAHSRADDVPVAHDGLWFREPPLMAALRRIRAALRRLLAALELERHEVPPVMVGLDAVLTRLDDGAVRFHPGPAPSVADVAAARQARRRADASVVDAQQEDVRASAHPRVSPF